MFAAANSFSAESGIYRWQFLFWTPLKRRVKPQKEPLELICKKWCSEKFRKFHKKTPCWRFFIIEFGSSYRRCSTKRAALKNLSIFTGKHLCLSLFLIRLHTCRPVTLLKRGSRCFPVNIAKFLGTPFSQNTPGWLLLRGLQACNFIRKSLRHRCFPV